MYNILLVDDELPAIRLLDTIINKYTTGFTVTEKLRDGKSALEWLQCNTTKIDILITDIRMPDMDGISLAKAARKIMPGLHIVIVSGYQEFEYAHGAIEAAVDDYILKPVSVSHMTELLDKIRMQLDKHRIADISKELTALLCQKPYNKEVITKYYDCEKYYFALIRIGNVPYTGQLLHETRPSDNPIFMNYPDDIQVITGKDDNEFLVYAPAKGSITSFQSYLKIKLSESSLTYTLVTAQTGMNIHSFGTFYSDASKLCRHSSVIGFSTCHILSDGENPKITATSKSATLSPTLIRQLELSVVDNDNKVIKQIFDYLADEWDNNHITQRQAYVMMQQILHLVEAARHNNAKSTDQVMLEADQLTSVAVNYRDLIDKLYNILFDESNKEAVKMSPEDLYNFAIQSIHKNFNQPINIQSICSEIGISQTYLSRLFRKYGTTSFNSYLINCRIENACKMIEERPDTPLHKVAACVGYEDYAYFSKVFKEIVGCSPSQYLSKNNL